jgi:cysteine-rich repeat protein
MYYDAPVISGRGSWSSAVARRALLAVTLGGALISCALDPMGQGASEAGGAQAGGGGVGAGGIGGGAAGGAGGAAPGCGDGVIGGNEACDDGNTAPGDGCSGCAVEAGFSCAKEPSECAPIPAQVVEEGPALAIGIPDGSYNGSPDSMGCATLAVTARGSVRRVEVAVAIQHVFLGDLIVKVESPTGRVLTLMNRPGVDEPQDQAYEPSGHNTDLVATHPITFRDDASHAAEDMGSRLSNTQAACRDDGRCAYVPSPGAGPGTDLTDFIGELAAGDWRVCVGDGDNFDAGTLELARLTILSW